MLSSSCAPPQAESDTTSIALVVAPVTTDERTEEVMNVVEESSSIAFPGSKTDDPAELYSRRRLALEWTKLDDKPGGANNDDFGTPSCLSGDGKVLAVGAIDSDPSGTSSGSVHVYEKNSGTGLLVQRGKVLALTGVATGAQFGWSVSLSDNGNVLAVGAPGDNGRGTVRLYTYASLQYNPFGPILSGGNGDRFGHSVSLSGDGAWLAVGAPNRPFVVGGATSGSGIVQVYQVNSVAGTIVPFGGNLSPLITVPPSPTVGFGYSVSLSDNGAFLGISTATAISGQVVRIYDRQTAKYEPVLGTGCTITNGEAITFSGDGISNRFAVRDIVAGVVKVYRINAGTCDVVNTAGVVPISSNFGARDEILFSLSDDGNVLAIADTPGFLGNVLVYELLLATTGVNQMEYKQSGSFINVPGSTAVSLSDDGKLVAIGTPSRMGITGGFEDDGFTYLYEWKSTTTPTVIPPIVSSLIEQVSTNLTATTSLLFATLTVLQPWSHFFVFSKGSNESTNELASITTTNSRESFQIVATECIHCLSTRRNVLTSSLLSLGKTPTNPPTLPPTNVSL